MDRRVDLKFQIPAVTVVVADRGHGRVGKLAGFSGGFDLLAHYGRLDRVLKLDMHRHAAGEVDVQQARPASDDPDQSQHDQQARGDRRQPPLADEVELRFAQQPHHAQSADPAFALGNVEDHPRAEDRREHTQQDAEKQRHGEALELVAADQEQHDGHDQRRQVRVDNRARGAAEPVADGQAQRGAAIEFFADALENQHVGVDGHAHGEHQAGDARQAEGSLNGNHQRQNQQQIQHQREAGHDAGKTVIDQHEHEHGNQRGRHGHHASTDQVGALRGAHLLLADRPLVQGRGQAAGVEHADQKFDVFIVESSGDFAPIRNLTLEVRRREQLSVEHDSQSAEARRNGRFVRQVVVRQIAESLGPGAVEPKTHRLASVAYYSRGARQVAARDVVTVDDDKHLGLLADRSDDIDAVGKFHLAVLRFFALLRS